jgi:hypothetical protein
VSTIFAKDLTGVNSLAAGLARIGCKYWVRVWRSTCLNVPEHISTTPSQELDRSIQVSLVTSIRRAANAHKAVPATTPCPDSLETYLLALESLAEYVSAKWRGEAVVPEFEGGRQWIGAPHAAAADENSARIGRFASHSSGSDIATPFGAA